MAGRMTRETKVGLLFGVAVVIAIGLILADLTSSFNERKPANLAESGSRVGESTSMTAQRGDSTSLNRGSLTRRSDGGGVQGKVTPTVEGQTYRSRGVPRGFGQLRNRKTTAPQFPKAIASEEREGNQSTTEKESTTKPTPKKYVTKPIKPTSFRKTITTGHEQTPVRRYRGMGATTNHAKPSLMSSYQQKMLKDQNRVEAKKPVVKHSGSTLFDRNPKAMKSRDPYRAWQKKQSQPVKTQKREPRIHYVKPNENLYKIAKTYYGDGEKWPLIAKANPKAVRENGHVNEKVRLVIPADPDTIKKLEEAQAGGASLSSTGKLLRPGVSEAKTIKVKPGDTLGELSSKYLGSSKYWKEIVKANKDQIKNANEIRAGMTLKLPNVGKNKATKPGADSGLKKPKFGSSFKPSFSDKGKKTAKSSGSGRTYKVKAGESLYGIAKKQLGNGGRWREIFDLNKGLLSSPDAIKAGQTIKLPAK